MPKISYLIATKNRAKLIGETLQSLVDQSEKDWEAIIIDDHGNDNTSEVIEKFADKRMKYYRLTDPHGHGASCARNFAAIRASAPIVAIIDSDDLCYPERSRATLEAFKKDPKLDVFYGDIDIWEEKKNIVRDRKTPHHPFSVERLLEVNFIPHSTVAMKRQILLDNPYNQFFRIAEDYDLLTRLAVAGKRFSFTSKKLVKYRLGDTNISGGGKEGITKIYDSLVKMVRRRVPYDKEILDQIAEAERIKEKK